MRPQDLKKRRSIREEHLGELSQKHLHYEASDSHSPMRISRQNILATGEKDENLRQKTADIKLKDEYQQRLSRIEKLQANVAQLENTNKQLFEKYSKNEKKLVLVLKKVKEENQTLLRNLKKLLAKPNIETKMMLENPAYSKFQQKMKSRKKKASNQNSTDNQKQDLEKKIKEEQVMIDSNFEEELKKISSNIDLMNLDNKNIFKMMTRSFQPPTWLKALMYAQQVTGGD